MAHMIEKNHAFFVGKPAWHRKGVVLDSIDNTEDALKIAYPYMLTEVKLQALLEHEGQTLTHDIQEHKFIMRSDGKEIGPVTAGYNLLQPYEMFHGMDQYLEKELITLEAGGSLCGGKRAWILGKIANGKAEVLPNDPIEAYLLAASGFDGSLSYIEMLTATRVVCQNTLSAASDNKGLHGMKFKFKHTKNLRTKIANAKNQIEECLTSFYTSVEQYKAIAAKKMDRRQMENYVTEVFISKEMVQKLKDEHKDPSPQLMAKVNRVINLLDTQAGLDLVPAARGTAWQAYNAITQYLTHEHGRSDESRLNAQWFGESADVNRRAFQLALN